MPAPEAYDHVIANAGTSLVRDRVDLRLIEEAQSLGALGQIISNENDPPMNGPGPVAGTATGNHARFHRTPHAADPRQQVAPAMNAFSHADLMTALPDKACREDVRTYYGRQPLHHLLERCTWHSAQHARQIISVLERFGIQADGPLTARDYAGLPMPAGLWE